MAGILKNQILKHLSRFVKNLSPDKISLSTLKGEGELSNLELEEGVLTELLSLPTWMKLTHAHCNRALIRIQWTKLKSVPIMLSLDEVKIVVEACEELRQEASSGGNVFPSAPSKYGFVNKVIDGITAVVNSVEITFHSQAFESKVQISRIRVESRSPQWKKTDLVSTRLKDADRGEVLIFKEMDWQTLRLEARSTSDRHLAPLRLLTNQAKARIVIKKRLIDCQVTSCRLSLILDDLLWVLTDSQILAALHFMSSLSGLIKQATETTQRVKAKRKLESLPEYQAQRSQSTAMTTENRSAAGKIFDVFDVKETSYHFLCEKIDLHFCDDPGTGRSQHPDLKDGGALQLSITQVLIDFYPYHLAKGNRKAWPKYSESQVSQWLHNALSAFRIELLEAVSMTSMHSPLARTQHQSGGHPQMPDNNPVRNCITDQLTKLMSTCLVLKIQDMRLFRVTTSSKREVPQPFLSSYIERPKDLPTIHAEFSWFYYPGEICFPLPSPKVFAHIHPIQIHLDVCTVLWLNTFISNLQNAMTSTSEPQDADYADVRIELIMPKIVFENKLNYPSQKERPNSVNFQVSRMVVSNYRSSETGTLHQLTQCLELLQRGDLAFGAEFPSKEDDSPLIDEKFIAHAEGRDKIRPLPHFKCSTFQEISPHLTKDMLWTEPRDVWHIYMDPFWADFRVETKRKPLANSQPRKINVQNPEIATSTVVYPFIDSLPVSIWIYLKEEIGGEQKSDDEKTANNGCLPNKTALIGRKSSQKSIKAVFSANGICNVQLTHYQFLFLMRMTEALREMSMYITTDLKQIIGDNILDNLTTFLGFGPTIELSILFPPLVPGKQESPSLELDSTIPESSSGEMDQNAKDSEDNQWNLVERERQQRSSLSSGIHNSMNSSPVNNTSLASMESFRTSLTQGVKHGLSSLAVSFNKGGGVSTPDSEVASTWSNYSSESSENNFIQIENLDMGEEAVEIATEVGEDFDRSTPSPTFSQEHTILRAENDNMISVLTVRLDGVEMAQEARCLQSIVKFQCRSLSLKECTGISWNEFQTKFAARNRKWAQQVADDGPLSPMASMSSPTQKRVVKIRLAQTINAEAFNAFLNSPEILEAISAAKNKTPTNPRLNLADRPNLDSPLRKGLIDSTVATLDGLVDLRNEEVFVLHMSTVMGLSEFFEDEIIPEPFPMELEVIGAQIELIEDRPSMSITSPGPIPVKFSIPNTLPVSRDNSGVFVIGSRNSKIPSVRGHTSGNSKPTNSDGNTIDQNDYEKALNKDIKTLKLDLEKTQRRLELVLARNTEMEEQLRTVGELKVMVVQLQEQVSTLHEEKFQLLDKMRQYKENHH